MHYTSILPVLYFVCVCVCVCDIQAEAYLRCSQLFSGKNILVKFREFVVYPYINLLNTLNLQFSTGKPIYVSKCVC